MQQVKTKKFGTVFLTDEGDAQWEKELIITGGDIIQALVNLSKKGEVSKDGKRQELLV
jgi:hypothetical protein